MITIPRAIPVVLTLALAIALLASSGVSQDPKPEPQPDTQKEPTLHQRMEAFEDGKRALRRIISDATQKEKVLEILATMQANFTAAKSIVPTQVSKIEDAEARAKMATTYRIQLVKVLRVLCDIEIAVLEGRGTDAANLLRSLGSLEHESHEKLGVDEGH
ncbi:MAG: hypothetical protein AB7K09_03090 [Planctomycetota bacterium]